MNQVSVLVLDKSGFPIEWASWQSAATLYAREVILWTLGDVLKTVVGGFNRISGCRSTIDLHSIVAVDALASGIAGNVPALSNRLLFARDEYLCLYCGNEFHASQLTRDHVHPVSRGGQDVWENVVSACRRCNQHKANRLPEEAGMPLLALPYTPKHREYLMLQNSGRILTDQMAFLKKGH